MRDDLRGLPALNAAQESLIHITIPVGMLQCNCSIIGDPLTREALVVDPGDEVMRILDLLGRRRLTVKAIVSTHAHIDHVGGLSKLHQYTGAPVLMHRDDLPLYQAMDVQASFMGVLPSDLTEVDQLLKEGDVLRWGSLEAQVIHTPGHTPGVLTTEGITVYDQGKPYKAIPWGGAGYRGGLAEAEQSVTSANKVAQIKGVQVNLQIHSWAGDDGYPGGGVLERGVMLKSRKPGDPHPFVDPDTFTRWVKRTQDEAAKAVQEEKKKAGK